MWIKTDIDILINSDQIIEIYFREERDRDLFSIRAYEYENDSGTEITSFKTREEAKEYMKILYNQLNANV